MNCSYGKPVDQKRINEIESENKSNINKPEAIDQCYICKLFYEERILKLVMVADQGGYVHKKICPKCTNDIKLRSNVGLASPQTDKTGELLMEGKE